MARHTPDTLYEPKHFDVDPLNFVWRDNGESYNFFTLPRVSQERIIQYGVNQLQDDKATGAIGKAKKLIAGDDGKASDVTGKMVASWRESDPDNEAQFESWRSEFMAMVRDAALSGELESVRVSESQVSKDRNEAARRLLVELYAEIDDRAGKPRRVVFLPTQGPKKAVNEANAAANGAKVAELLGSESRMAKFAPRFDRHMAAIADERTAASTAAKAKSAAVVVDSLDELDAELNEAAE